MFAPACYIVRPTYSLHLITLIIFPLMNFLYFRTRLSVNVLSTLFSESAFK